MNLFDFSLQLSGFPIKDASRLLKTIQDINERDYISHIETKKDEIVEYHLKNKSFY